MPSYKFFEPKHEKQPATQFAEFELSTDVRSKKRAIKENEEQKPKTFKALSVPDFGKPKRRQSVQPLPRLTRCVEFSLSTETRGIDKQQRLQEQRQSQLTESKTQCEFKATPIKCNLQGQIPERIRSEKKPTVPVGMSLASQERSAKRDLFEQVKKERQL